MTEQVPYKESFPLGSQVRIADRDFLEQFLATWEYHHKLAPEQLNFAGLLTRVESVSYYHGGDVLYKLKGVPGMWHEPCLRSAGD
jgi:hypothetical protein